MAAAADINVGSIIIKKKVKLQFVEPRLWNLDMGVIAHFIGFFISNHIFHSIQGVWESFYLFWNSNPENIDENEFRWKYKLLITIYVYIVINSANYFSEIIWFLVNTLNKYVSNHGNFV